MIPLSGRVPARKTERKRKRDENRWKKALVENGANILGH
jgi:hypothetical protein